MFRSIKAFDPLASEANRRSWEPTALETEDSPSWSRHFAAAGPTDLVRHRPDHAPILELPGPRGACVAGDVDSQECYVVCEALGRHALFARMGILPGPPNRVRADKVVVVSPGRYGPHEI